MSGGTVDIFIRRVCIVAGVICRRGIFEARGGLPRVRIGNNDVLNVGQVAV